MNDPIIVTPEGGIFAGRECRVEFECICEAEDHFTSVMHVYAQALYTDYLPEVRKDFFRKIHGQHPLLSPKHELYHTITLGSGGSELAFDMFTDGMRDDAFVEGVLNDTDVIYHGTFSSQWYRHKLRPYQTAMSEIRANSMELLGGRDIADLNMKPIFIYDRNDTKGYHVTGNNKDKIRIKFNGRPKYIPSSDDLTVIVPNQVMTLTGVKSPSSLPTHRTRYRSVPMTNLQIIVGDRLHFTVPSQRMDVDDEYLHDVVLAELYGKNFYEAKF